MPIQILAAALSSSCLPLNDFCHPSASCSFSCLAALPCSVVATTSTVVYGVHNSDVVLELQVVICVGSMFWTKDMADAIRTNTVAAYGKRCTEDLLEVSSDLWLMSGAWCGCI